MARDAAIGKALQLRGRDLFFKFDSRYRVQVYSRHLQRALLLVCGLLPADKKNRSLCNLCASAVKKSSPSDCVIGERLWTSDLDLRLFPPGIEIRHVGTDLHCKPRLPFLQKTLNSLP